MIDTHPEVPKPIKLARLAAAYDIFRYTSAFSAELNAHELSGKLLLISTYLRSDLQLELSLLVDAMSSIVGDRYESTPDRDIHTYWMRRAMEQVSDSSGAIPLT